MPVLAQTQKEKVLIHLGYSNISVVVGSLPELGRELPATVIARVDAILTYLDGADAAVDAATRQAAVKKVGSLEFEYGQLVASQKDEAARQLRELANLLGLGVQFDKYSSSSSGGSSSIATITDY